MSAFKKFDLSLIPSAGERARVAQVAQTAQEDRSCATFATCAGSERADAEDLQAFFHERAGIAEHDGGLSRADAERRAFESCIVEWLNRNPAPSDPERCAWCGEPDVSGSAVLPFGTETHGHTWLHPQCWDKWYLERRTRAHEALKGLGLTAPETVAQESSESVKTPRFPNDFG